MNNREENYERLGFKYGLIELGFLALIVLVSILVG